MPAKLLKLSPLKSFALVLSLLLSACVTSLTPQPTDNPVTQTARAASPTPVPPSATVAPPATETPAPAPSPEPCSALNLTPEECANQGTHRYSITYEELNGCETTGEDHVGEWTTSFDSQGVDMGDGHAIQQGPNSYLWVQGPDWTVLITYDLGGFVMDQYWTDVHCVHTAYVLVE